MNYGIVSEKDDKTSLDFMKSKKVEVTNMYPSYKLSLLVSRLICGDVIYVISVDRFPSVSRFVAFADRVLMAGVALKIMNEPYLEVGNGKHWRPAIQRHMDTLVVLENANVNRLLGTIKLPDVLLISQLVSLQRPMHRMEFFIVDDLEMVAMPTRLHTFGYVVFYRFGCVLLPFHQFCRHGSNYGFVFKFLFVPV